MDFKRMGDEWDIMRKDMEKIRKKNKSLSNQMATLSRKHDKEVASLKKELAETKALLSEERRISDERNQAVEGLKRVFNQVLICAEDRKQQEIQLTTEEETVGIEASTSEHDITTAVTDTATPVQESDQSDLSTPGATADLTSTETSAEIPLLGQVASNQLETKATGSILKYDWEYRQRTRSRVQVYCTHRPLQSMETVKVDDYDRVNIECEFMDLKTGMYTIPYKGEYIFSLGIGVFGSGVVRLYLCGGDGRRETDGDSVAGVDMRDEKLRSSFRWYCPEGMTVWMEVEGGPDCVNTTFRAWFECKRVW